MYLKNIIIENMGAIERFELLEKDLIKEDKNPRVVILVGQNGSGKTTLLSSIVDAFYEFGNDNFEDILPRIGMGYRYFKLIGFTNRRLNTEYAFNYLQFEHKTKIYEYVDMDKNNKLNLNDFQTKTKQLLNLWSNKERFKIHTSTKGDEEFKNEFIGNSYCYFPSDRFEYPYWMGEDIKKYDEQLSDKKTFSTDLNKKITIRENLREIKNWILDVFLDKHFEFELNSGINEIQKVRIFHIVMKNIEEIISQIINKDIVLGVNLRTHNNSRLKLIDKNTNRDYLPSLDNLSAGQSTLLSIFMNIIRQSENIDIMRNLSLGQISGIVVIDEIDLHLHIELQKEILPKLIKLFPKVQFIVTSHSPFFLNGMAKIFEQDDYIVVNMPSGKILDTYDEFEEFNKAYEVFEDLTNDYKKERDLLKAELKESTKPIIITEGKTDWKHLKKALDRFKKEGFYTDLDIEFLEYEDNIKMGDSALDSMVKAFEKTKQSRKTIFMFDRDSEDKNIKKYSNEEFNNHSNNVFSFCIPKIDNILDKISLEFYYKENDLKTVDETGRRLFLSSEFNQKTAVSKCHNFVTQDKNKASKDLVIIDDVVFSLNDEECKINLALSKNNFAENILKNIDNFNSFDIENFKKIFEVIEKILK